MALYMLGPSFTEMRNTSLFTDAVIKSRSGQEWKVHRVVMSRLGRFLYTAFSYPHFTGTIDLAVTDQVVQVIIDLAYKGECTINEENVLDVLEAAVMYQLEPLIEKCVCFVLENMISPRHVIAVKMFVKLHKEELETCTDGVLIHKVDNWIRRNFIDICDKEEILDLSSEDLEEYFKEDDLNMAEDDLLKFADNYINMQRLSKDKTTKLLANVRLSLVSPSKVLKIADQSLVLFLEAERRSKDCHSRCPRDITMVFHYFWDDDGNELWKTITGHVYNGRKNEWTILYVDDINENFSHEDSIPEFVMAGNILYVMQFNDLSEQGKIQMMSIDMRSGRSLGVQQLDFPDTHPSFSYEVVAYNDGIVATMGKFAAFYDPVQNKWSRLPAPYGGDQASLVVVNGNLFAIGGFLDGREEIAYNEIEYYDNESKTWNICGVMKNIKGFNRVTVLDGKVYVFPSGDTSLDEGECFQPIFENGRFILNWFPPIKMPWTEESSFKVSSIDDKILFIDCESEDCHVFSPRNREWSPAAKLMDRGEILDTVSIVNNMAIEMGRIEELCNGQLQKSEN